jgi:hypothetical protein
LARIDLATFVDVQQKPPAVLGRRRSDISIAPMVLGGNMFGWTADDATSFPVLDRFAAAGQNEIA